MIYEFCCRSCGRPFEVTATLQEKEAGLSPACPRCGSADVRRVYSRVMFLRPAGEDEGGRQPGGGDFDGGGDLDGTGEFGGREDLEGGGDFGGEFGAGSGSDDGDGGLDGDGEGSGADWDEDL